MTRTAVGTASTSSCKNEISVLCVNVTVGQTGQGEAKTRQRHGSDGQRRILLGSRVVGEI